MHFNVQYINAYIDNIYRLFLSIPNNKQANFTKKLFNFLIIFRTAFSSYLSTSHTSPTTLAQYTLLSICSRHIRVQHFTLLCLGRHAKTISMFVHLRCTRH